MANDVRAHQGKSHSPLMKAIQKAFGSLPDANVAAIEERVGLLLGDLSMEVHFRMEANLLAAILARAQLMKKVGEPVNLSNLLGDPARDGRKGSLVRGRLKQIYALWHERGQQPMLTLAFLLPEGHPMIPVIEEVVKSGLPKVLEEEFLGKGKPPMPKISFRYIGLQAGETKGHSPLLIAAARERQAPPAPKQ